MTSSGMRATGAHIHSGSGMVLLRQKSLMSIPMKRALSVEMTLLKSNFAVNISAVGVETAPGQ